MRNSITLAVKHSRSIRGDQMQNRPSRRMTRVALVAIAVLALAHPGSLALAQSTAPAKAPARPASHPNIVFVLTDDLSWNLVQYMPHVLQMQKDGVTFAHYFVTDSLCCPSRSSIFTGRYPHDTGVFRNTGEDGGYSAFQAHNDQRATYATALAAAGYHAAMLGKYLNGYRPRKDKADPGWTSWSVAGDAYKEFNYDLNQNGKVHHYAQEPQNYLTDVVSGLATSWIKRQKGTPFVIEVATFAPHAPYIPAPRDADKYPGLQAPRTQAFDAAPDANAPNWLKEVRALSRADIARINKAYRMRAQSVLAVDEMIGQLQAAVTAIGEQNNTYFVFSSDNGLHMGEYRLMPGKMTPYDIDVHVPLIITGPGVAAGRTVQGIVQNIDLTPTFAELTGATTPGDVDGRSLAALLQGPDLADWRTATLVEHHSFTDPNDPDAPEPRSGNPPSYEAFITPTTLYVEYVGGVMEYHNLSTDPWELHNTYASLSPTERQTFHARLQALINCHSAQSCWAAAHF